MVHFQSAAANLGISNSVSAILHQVLNFSITMEDAVKQLRISGDEIIDIINSILDEQASLQEALV